MLSPEEGRQIESYSDRTTYFAEVDRGANIIKENDLCFLIWGLKVCLCVVAGGGALQALS